MLSSYARHQITTNLFLLQNSLIFAKLDYRFALSAQPLALPPVDKSVQKLCDQL
jgi:hypothetical protein